MRVLFVFFKKKKNLCQMKMVKKKNYQNKKVFLKKYRVENDQKSLFFTKKCLFE